MKKLIIIIILKPSNILLNHDKRFIKISDFGGSIKVFIKIMHFFLKNFYFVKLD